MGGAPAGCVQYNLFPTPVMTFEDNDPSLDDALANHFLTHPRYARADQAERSDSLNLMDFVGETEAFVQLQTKFIRALKEYCQRAGWTGDFDLAMQMFPNFAPARHYVPSHNHVAHIAAVYYVQTPVFDDKPLVETDADISDYWRAEEGVLILHDPRFNASLNGGWQQFARVYPKPGLLIMFPAFLWHEVTPHYSQAVRLSVAANFTLTPKGDAFEHQLDFSV